MAHMSTPNSTIKVRGLFRLAEAYDGEAMLSK